MVTVLDASGCVLGRLASTAAQHVLNEDDELVIVNCEKAIVTGDREDVLARYEAKHKRGTQRKGPFYPRVPHRLVKRTIRGMLPYNKPRGSEAFDRVKCHISVPEAFEDEEALSPEDAQPKSVTPSVEVAEISRYLGAKV